MIGIDIEALKAKAKFADEKLFAMSVDPRDVLVLIDRVEKAEAARENSMRACEAAGQRVAAWSEERNAMIGIIDRAGKRGIPVKEAAAEVVAENSRLRALLARAAEALTPFHLLAPGEARDWTDEHGWTDRAPKNERICDWFGPTDFRIARTVAAEIEKEIGND